jgi:hypothetical protein
MIEAKNKSHKKESHNLETMLHMIKIPIVGKGADVTCLSSVSLYSIIVVGLVL